MAAARFRCRQETIRPFMLDAISSGAFRRADGVIKTAFEPEVESWESEHHLPEQRMPSGGFVDVALNLGE